MTDILLLPGDQLWVPDDVDALPNGTVLAVHADPRTIFTKQDDGTWRQNNSYRTSDVKRMTQGDPGYLALRSYPAENSPVPPPTLRRYQWAFRDVVRYGSASYSTGMDKVREAIERFGLGDENFPLGTGLRIQNTTDRDRIPAGSTLIVGDPRRFQYFGLAQRVDRTWLHVLGQYPVGVGPVARLDLVAGERVYPDWLTEAATEQDALGIAEFKAQMWTFGYKAKMNARPERWCSAFESIMSRVQIDSTCVAPVTHHGIAVGAMIGPRQALTLPVGTLLRWTMTREPETVSWYERVDPPTNPAGTRLVFGYRRDGSRIRSAYASSMRVMYLPHADVPNVGVDLNLNDDHRGAVPVGTEFLYDGTNRYFLCENGRLMGWGRNQGYPTSAQLASGSYSWADFGDLSRLRAVSFVGSPVREGVR